MTRLEYTDGSSITLEEAAALIEAEGKLITVVFGDSLGRRCLTAVLENRRGQGTFHARRLSHESNIWLSLHGVYIQDNDYFVGTPEARAAHFAARFRELAQEEEA